MKRVLFVANPTAQSGKAQERIGRTREALIERGLQVELLPTEPDGRTIEAVRTRVQDRGLDAVIAMGGDGTFADVAKGILAADRRCPMGLIPAGTANDQARSLGIPLEASPDAAVAIACGAHVTRLDVGCAQRLVDGQVEDEQLFFDSVGFGFQAEVLKKRHEDKAAVDKVPVLREVYRDYAVYAGALLDAYLKSFVEPTRMAVEIVADGRAVSFPSLIDVVVKNTAIYGGAWVLARDGVPDDGKMEIVPFFGRRNLAAKILTDLSALPNVEKGLEILGVEAEHTLAASLIELRLSRPDRPEVTAQIDGDPWCEGHHFRISVEKNEIEVRTPAGFSPPWRAAS